ncbi:putative disease resistance RPP13-like protein 1 [Rosa chinensis]|nr:putative disease resistance RPP13-like protein 1 [Rosa chinensis]
MVVEVFLGAFLQVLLERLTPQNLLSFGHFQGVEKKFKKWSTTLSAIRAVLQDAEKKQLTSEAVKLWLDELKHLAFDMDDFLDTFSTQLLVINHQNGAGTSKVQRLFSRVKFNYNMNSEMGNIADRLQVISDRKDKLGLVYSDDPGYPRASQRLPSSYVLDGPVVGRDEDKRKIVELLLRDHEPCCTTNFQVLAIVGMPGLGKTTLAGHVFNDKEMGLFNPKVWVSVSDSFSLERLTKTIFKLVTSRDSDDLDEFSKVQDLLSEALAGKKFLIVLDDVWSTCDYDSWTKLQSPFRVGASGSQIVVTTREEKVAKLIGATHVYDLKTLSNEDCLEVFQQHINSNRPPNFNLLCKKIVEKCNGLPLAAKTLGGILRCKEAGSWEEVLDDKLWSVSNNESNILTVLKLSYHYLPSNLKRCFAYCSILPKQYEFGKKQLILLWMAEGFLHQSHGSKEMEDIGGDYFGELLSRSLFQKSSKNNSRYEMHDLVGDLARWAAGDICFRLEDNLDGRCSPKTRYSSYSSGKFDGVKKFEAFSKAKRLRTFLPVSVLRGRENHQTRKVASDLLPNMKYLRVLSFSGYQITELPDSIGRLKHLRYLDLSHTLIMSLPDSISSLYNLQTLILENCSKLKALPSNIRNLINLRHLNNSSMLSLEGMPPQLGQLTSLQTLSCFVVGKARESGVKEIGPLYLLRGTLCLSRLENVIDVEDARRADLICKEGLDALQLEWSGRGEKESDVLDMLKPHRNLKELTIKGYGGLELPSWICNPLFSVLVLLRLENCNNCRFLPQLGQLPSLKELFIRGMSQVESVGIEFYGEGTLSFPVLENLVFEDMQQWKGWFPCEEDQIGVFPSLKMLSVIKCPQLVVSITNYTQLCALQVHDCNGVVFRGAVDFELLEHMYLSNLSVLRLEIEKSAECMRGLRNVQGLGITNSEESSSSWQNEDIILQHLSSLRSLFIERNSKFLQLHHLTSLQALRLYRCASLVSIPKVCLPPSLKDLWIERCDSLTYFARYQIPPSLRRAGIRECKRLKLLVGENVEGYSSSSSSHCLMQEDTSCLEYLEVWECPSLTSLSSRGQLPRALKHLHIRDCERLESITDMFHSETCLEHIVIQSCANLKSLPEGLCDLMHLQQLIVMDCGSLVSFPRGGLPTTVSNLTSIYIYNCDSLEAFPRGMDKYISLQTLWIGYCKGLSSILEEGFSPNLVELYIVNPLRCTPLCEWGLQLHRLNSLRELWIQGVDPNLVLFPPEEMEMLLPKSLIKIRIGDFPKLRRLSSKALQSLTSLESLRIEDCPKLASIPEEKLSLSLTQLHISNCPLLKKRYRPGKAPHWPKIGHIPYIQIGE